ncbi:MAG: hypothetical protein ACE5KU_02980 [Nitrososphaerales archaeon]
MRVKIRNTFRLKGRVRVQVWDAKKYPTYQDVLTATHRGVEPLEEQVIDNLIVTAGKNHIADLLANNGGTVNCGYVGVGSSSQTPAVGDTDLITAIGSRKAVTDDSRTNNVANFSTFFASADNNGTWNESGLFWDATAGDMLARALFSPAITKDTTKTVTVDWSITVG